MEVSLAQLKKVKDFVVKEDNIVHGCGMDWSSRYVYYNKGYGIGSTYCVSIGELKPSKMLFDMSMDVDMKYYTWYIQSDLVKESPSSQTNKTDGHSSMWFDISYSVEIVNNVQVIMMLDKDCRRTISTIISARDSKTGKCYKNQMKVLFNKRQFDKKKQEVVENLMSRGVDKNIADRYFFSKAQWKREVNVMNAINLNIPLNVWDMLSKSASHSEFDSVCSLFSLHDLFDNKEIFEYNHSLPRKVAYCKLMSDILK